MSMQITITESLYGFRKGIKTLNNGSIIITSLWGAIIKLDNMMYIKRWTKECLHIENH